MQQSPKNTFYMLGKGAVGPGVVYIESDETKSTDSTKPYTYTTWKDEYGNVYNVGSDVVILPNLRKM